MNFQGLQPNPVQQSSSSGPTQENHLHAPAHAKKEIIPQEEQLSAAAVLRFKNQGSQTVVSIKPNQMNKPWKKIDQKFRRLSGLYHLYYLIEI